MGKTTALRRAAALLGDRAVRGFFTEEVRGPSGGRTGFRGVPLGPEAPASPSAEGELRGAGGAHAGGAHAKGAQGGRLIASVERRRPPRVGRYGVDVAAIDALADRHLGAEGADVVLLDEIGKMECCSERFVARVGELLAADLPLVATVARRGSGLVARAKEAPETELWEATVDGRDRLPEAIERWVRERLGSTSRR